MEHELGPRRGSSQLPTRHTLAPSDPNQASQLMLSQTSGNPGTPEGLGVQPKFSNHHDEPYAPDLGQQPGRPAIPSARRAPTSAERAELRKNSCDFGVEPEGGLVLRGEDPLAHRVRAREGERHE